MNRKVRRYLDKHSNKIELVIRTAIQVAPFVRNKPEADKLYTDMTGYKNLGLMTENQWQKFLLAIEIPYKEHGWKMPQ